VKLQRLPDKFGRERTFRFVSTGIGLLGAMLTKRLMRVVYRAARRDADPATPFDTTHPRFSWGEALGWGAAVGIGLTITKMVGDRAAAIGWEAATGTPAPAATEV
jgi:hypothetical protein